jgi:hypothetical protein
MARVALTDDQVARILAAPKVVTEDIRWRPKGNVSWVGCEVRVDNRLKFILHIHANASLRDRAKYAFALILSRSYRIVSFEAKGSHRNRHTDSQKWLGEPHKNRWTELCRDSFAYTPADIDTASMESAFRSFCKEIGVDFHGTVEPVPASQIGMEY